jgi:hypothetical protein
MGRVLDGCLLCSDAGLCGAGLRLCIALLVRVTVSQCCKLGRIIFCPLKVKCLGGVSVFGMGWGVLICFCDGRVLCCGVWVWWGLVGWCSVLVLGVSVFVLGG